MARVMAAEGEIVCGVVTLSRRDLSKGRGNGRRLRFPCALPAAGTVRVELVMEPDTKIMSQPALRINEAGWTFP
jgi:hypothetical protein